MDNPLEVHIQPIEQGGVALMVSMLRCTSLPLATLHYALNTTLLSIKTLLHQNMSGNERERCNG